jgi:molybdopterin synthase catalytic subunit
MQFRFSTVPINTVAARLELIDRRAGGYVSFEGWVRDLNEGREFRRLEYEAFRELAEAEGGRILAEAQARFPIRRAACIHRLGSLELSEMAVWVGVSSEHRGEAFDACRYIIDEVKHRLPIWKKEHYVDGDSGWVNCERCAAPPQHASAPGAAAGHAHGAGHVHAVPGLATGHGVTAGQERATTVGELHAPRLNLPLPGSE